MKAIDELKHKIKHGEFPKNHKHFAGANLIITNDPNYHGLKHDERILTSHAGALSWLVFELKKIYESKLDAKNKYNFYPYIGQLIQASVEVNDDLFETMFFVIEKIEEDWGEEKSNK